MRTCPGGDKGKMNRCGIRENDDLLPVKDNAIVGIVSLILTDSKTHIGIADEQKGLKVVCFKDFSYGAVPCLLFLCCKLTFLLS